MKLDVIEPAEGLGPEADRLAGSPHPREMLSLIGHRDAELAVLQALKSGRMHHAWLITGEEGIGKATFAYRIARFLLATMPEARAHATDLAVSIDHPVAHQIAAGGHPDLAVIRRTHNQSGKAFSVDIRVDNVRQGLDVFTKTAASGGYRIAIVDCCDDLNANSANALLKTLEEPPAQSLFLLVAHQPGRLLPTIRSRCRTLKLQPLSDAEVEAGILGMPNLGALDPATISAAVAESGGSLRRALTMLDQRKLEFNGRLRALFEALPVIDGNRLDATAEATTGRTGDDAFQMFCDGTERWLAEKLRLATISDAQRAAIATTYASFTDDRRDVDIYNLDRRAFVLQSVSSLADALRAH